jgi:hypothetical protein
MFGEQLVSLKLSFANSAGTGFNNVVRINIWLELRLKKFFLA